MGCCRVLLAFVLLGAVGCTEEPESAKRTSYDDSETALGAQNTQEAIDELNAKIVVLTAASLDHAGRIGAMETEFDNRLALLEQSATDHVGRLLLLEADTDALNITTASHGTRLDDVETDIAGAVAVNVTQTADILTAALANGDQNTDITTAALVNDLQDTAIANAVAINTTQAANIASHGTRLGLMDTKGLYIGNFTPTVSQATPPTLASPGGQMAGHGGGIVYNPATGRIGVRAANEICAAITDFPGRVGAVASAHACSATELGLNVRKGLIQEGTTGWSYSSGSETYADYPTVPDPTPNSFKHTCGNWTYDTGDTYTGTEFAVVDADLKSVAGAGLATELKLTTGTSCAAVRQIACCE